MVLLDDDIYQETKQIALGRARKSPLGNELSTWFMRKYKFHILNLWFSKPVPNSRHHTLTVIIEKTTDYDRMFTGPFEPKAERQGEILSEFRKLALKHKFVSEAQLDHVSVSYINFSDEAMAEANWKAIKEAQGHLKGKYPVIWEVIAMFSSTVVFYHQDADIAAQKESGLSDRISEEYYNILKKYDDLDYFTRKNMSIKFDSKENVDGNYEGNLFYYTR